MIKILTGDCRETLKTLPDASVHCCVTSPPYWGLRDYGTAKWEGGDAACNHRQVDIRQRRGLAAAANASDGGNRTQAARNDNDLGIPFRDICGKCGARRIDSQIGLEQTPEAYVAELVAVFREVRRVLRPDGTLWLNLGDSYWGGKGASGSSKARATAKERGYVQSGGTVQMNKRPQDGTHDTIKPKDLVGIPWRVAFALQADGWYLRQDIIWAKPNPMPESVTDRCTKAHEYIFLLSKSAKYYYDHEAIKEPVTQSSIERLSQPNLEHQAGSDRVPGKTNGPMKAVGRGGKNAFRGQGSNRDTETGPANRDGRDMKEIGTDDTRNKRSVWTVCTQPYKEAHFATFPRALIEPCILAGCPAGGVVLDPFGGSGTTGEVAASNGRDSILIELNPAYVKLAADRGGLFVGGSQI
jgi:DNA modification methylase